MLFACGRRGWAGVLSKLPESLARAPCLPPHPRQGTGVPERVGPRAGAGPQRGHEGRSEWGWGGGMLAAGAKARGAARRLGRKGDNPWWEGAWSTRVGRLELARLESFCCIATDAPWQKKDALCVCCYCLSLDMALPLLMLLLRCLRMSMFLCLCVLVVPRFWWLSLRAHAANVLYKTD